MTVLTTTTRQDLLLVTGAEVDFNFLFKILAESDLSVYHIRAIDEVVTALDLTTDYTVSAGPWESGGTITLTGSIETAEDDRIVIVRNRPYFQLADYVEGDKFPAEAHETALDDLALQIQQLRRDVDNSVQTPEYEDGGFVLPPANERADQILGFDENGDPVLLPEPTSVTVAFHPTTGDIDTPPDLPVGALPWEATSWTEFPDADSVWISFSVGTDPEIDGWSAPTRFVGQDYAPNVYSDLTFAGPHSVTLPPGTPPEGQPTGLNGFINPGSLDVEIANAGGTTDSIGFVDSEGVSTTWSWEWEFGGTGVTINTPTARDVTLTVPAGQATYNGTLKVTASDGVNSIIRFIGVVIQVLAATPSPPSTLTAVAGPTDLDVTFDDQTAAYTGYVVVTPSGGRLPRSFSWSKVSGSPNITLSDVDPGNTDRMRFRAVNPDSVNGGVLNAVFRCTVRDSAQLDGFTQQSYLVDVPVQVTFNSSLGPNPNPEFVVAMEPNSLDVSLSAPSDEAGGTIDTQVLTPVLANGVAPYTYLWEWASGGTGITIVDDDGETTALRVGADNTTFTGVLQLTVTDDDANVAVVQVPISITTAVSAPALTATVSPTALTHSVPWGLNTSSFGRVTAYGAGGTLPYQFTWNNGVRLSGSTAVSVARSTNQNLPYIDFTATRASGSGTGSVTAVFRFTCTITDAGSKIATVVVDVTVTFRGQTTVPIPPGDLDPSPEEQVQ
jgi:hypothetical protein